MDWSGVAFKDQSGLEMFLCVSGYRVRDGEHGKADHGDGNAHRLIELSGSVQVEVRP